MAIGFVGVGIGLGKSRVRNRSACGRARMALSTEEGTTSAKKKQALVDLKARLVKELETQLDGGEVDISMYAKDVNFVDPLNNFIGAEKQKKNIEMLANSPIMSMDFFKLHDIWIDPKKEAVMTRWTLNLKFKLLPWKPVLRFTGTSEYGLDDDLLVNRHIDTWDSINKQTFSFEAVADLVSEMFRKDSGSADVGSMLLRRDVLGFEVRKVTDGIVAKCPYTNRGDGMDVLDRYFNGINEKARPVFRLAPLILNFPEGIRSERKSMYSYIAEKKPPRSTSEKVKVEVCRSLTVAVFTFPDPITPQNAAMFEKYLMSLIKKRGYDRLSDQVLFAQYTPVYTLPWLRKNEIWIPLANDY